MADKDFANATEVRNQATGTRYVRLPDTDLWSADRADIAGCVTTEQLESLPEMHSIAAEREG